MCLIEILNSQNTLLDSILCAQKELYNAVKTKNWINLESNLASVKDFSALFEELEEERNALCPSVEGIGASSEEGKVLIEIRTKLLQSKIANKALNDYIKITQNFVQGILDNVVPQRRNVLYSSSGKIIKPQPESVVLNRVF